MDKPAVPQSPNPELNIVDPDFRSATAESASLYSFEAPRTTFGAGSRFAFVFACCSYPIGVVWSFLAKGSRALAGPREYNVLGSPLRLDVAKQREDIRRVAIGIDLVRI